MLNCVKGAACVALVAGIAPAAAAEEACAERGQIVDQLKSKYAESHRASGLETDTQMVEIWTSKSSGTWTILVTRADGISCIAAAGRNWLDIEEDVVLGTSS